MARGLPLFVLLLASALPACSEPKPRPAVSDGWGPTHDALGAAATDAPTRPPVPRATAIPVDERRLWTRAGELDELDAIAGRGPSEHLSGRYERRVRVNEDAVSYEALVPHHTLPSGALVAQSHHAPGSDAVVSWYVMEKLDDQSWRFLVLDPERRIAARDDLEPCVRCHAEAPHDHLFGPPTTAQRAEP